MPAPKMSALGGKADIATPELRPGLVHQPQLATVTFQAVQRTLRQPPSVSRSEVASPRGRGTLGAGRVPPTARPFCFQVRLWPLLFWL
jgi:hypothetical protein